MRIIYCIRYSLVELINILLSHCRWAYAFFWSNSWLSCSLIVKVWILGKVCIFDLLDFMPSRRRRLIDVEFWAFSSWRLHECQLRFALYSLLLFCNPLGHHMHLFLLLFDRLYHWLSKLRRIYFLVIMKSKLIDNALIKSNGCIVSAFEFIIDGFHTLNLLKHLLLRLTGTHWWRYGFLFLWYFDVGILIEEIVIFFLDWLLLWEIQLPIIARCYFFMLLFLVIDVQSPLITRFIPLQNLLVILFLDCFPFRLQLQFLYSLCKLTNDRISKVKVLRLVSRKMIQQDRFIPYTTNIPNTKLIICEQWQFIDIRPHSQISSLSNFPQFQRLINSYLNLFFYGSKSQ